ncbi:MAG: aldo/keto reductase [Prevotella sp.]|jgi:predicted aldo/keto reductase-like oxidoreductase|nr:aldo/keto reductase [Prevotella sp.]
MERKGINRRNFLRLSATIGAGALLAPEAAASALNNSDIPADRPKIPVRTLGRTSIQVPILSMGVMRADNPNVVRAAYNSGVFHFDTAHGYQNGKNEEMLGNFFEDKPRDSFCIATKIGIRYPLDDNFEKDLNDKIELSLQRLKMDYVDIFYLHALRGVPEINDERVMAAVKKIKDEGKAHFIGFSTHALKPEQIHAAVDAGIYDVILLSYNFKLKNLTETDEAIERAAKAGVGVIAMKTMTGAKEDADGKKRVNAQACLKWAWQNPNIATAIPGFSNYDELDECLAAAQEPALTSGEQEYLASLLDKEMLFCQRCDACKTQCTNKLPVPEIMRAYMYAYGYQYARQAKDTLLELNLAQTDVCAGCSSCKVSCPSGFDVAKKIASVMPVMNVPDVFLS